MYFLPIKVDFFKGRGMMDSVLCLESAQASKEIVTAVFFEVKKAYNGLERGTLKI